MTRLARLANVLAAFMLGAVWGMWRIADELQMPQMRRYHANRCIAIAVMWLVVRAAAWWYARRPARSRRPRSGLHTAQ